MFIGWRIDAKTYLMWSPAVHGIFRLNPEEFDKFIGVN